MSTTASSPREQLIAAIHTAFSGVTLEEGVGLHEAQAIDDYEDQWVQKKYREEDEKLDWRKIPYDRLQSHQSSLSFFDPKGMRFHLPAFLIAELDRQLDYGVIFHLTHLNDFGLEKFTLLSREQNQVVVDFLWEMLKAPDHAYDRPHIESALENYWLHKIEPTA